MKEFDYLENLRVYDSFIQEIAKTKNHAYLLLTEDQYISKMLAVMLSCNILTNSNNYSNSLISRILKGRIIDVEMHSKNNKNIIVEDVKEIIKTCNIKPLEFKKKSYVLLDIDKATVQAQNKLLKTLEEPPKNVIFILTAKNERKVLPTVISRLNIIRPSKLQADTLLKILEANYSENTNIKTAINISNGNIGKAINYLESKTFFKSQEECLIIIDNLKSSDGVPDAYRQIMTYADFIEEIFNNLIYIFKDIIYIKNNTNINLEKHYNMINNISSQYSEKAALKAINKINSASIKLENNVSLAFVVNELLINILEDKHIWK